MTWSKQTTHNARTYFSVRTAIAFTHLDRDKMDAILQMIFPNLVSCVKIPVFWFSGSNKQQTNTGPNNGLAPVKQQDII